MANPNRIHALDAQLVSKMLHSKLAAMTPEQLEAFCFENGISLDSVAISSNGRQAAIDMVNGVVDADVWKAQPLELEAIPFPDLYEMPELISDDAQAIHQGQLYAEGIDQLKAERNKALGI